MNPTSLRWCVRAALSATVLAGVGLTLACKGGSSAVHDASTATAASAATTAPRPSAGCGAPAPAAGVQLEQMTANAVERTYRRFIPGTATGQAMPLLINLHGLLSNIDQQVAISEFETMAMQERFIVLTPQGAGTPPGGRSTGPQTTPI